MLDKLAQIAPLTTWALVLGSALLFLCGFVALGHAKLVRQAYGEPYRGVLAPDTLETMARWTVVFLATALLLWGLAQEWPAWVLGALGAVGALALLLELLARVRGRVLAEDG